MFCEWTLPAGVRIRYTLGMTSAGFLEGLFESKATIGGVGLILAVVVLGAAFVLLGASGRGKLKSLLVMFGAHLMLLVIISQLPEPSRAHSAVTVLALFLLLLVIARSGFFIFADSVLIRRWAQPLPKIIRDILQALVYAAVLLITLRAAGVDPSSLLTTSALLTAVIGLSMQETLGNMFAGLSIQAQEPFRVGDWIQIDGNDRLVGRVTEINWRATKLITNEEVEVIVPNGAIAKASIRNYSRPTPSSRRSVRVQAPYDISPARVREAMLDALHDAPNVLAQPPPSVVTEEFADHGVGYWGRFFIQDFSRRETIDSEVRDRIWFTFAREGISIPYPIRVNYNQDAADTQAEKDAEDRVRRRRALEKVDFLSSLPKDDMDELAGLITTQLFAPGESIIRQGRAGQELYIIEHGEVAVFLEMGEASGTPREIARLYEGEYFGEMSLMTGEARSATVRAVGEVELVMVDKPAFQRIIEDNPTVLEQISEGLAKRQSELKTNAEKTHPGAANLATDSHIILKRIRRFFSIG